MSVYADVQEVIGAKKAQTRMRQGFELISVFHDPAGKVAKPKADAKKKKAKATSEDDGSTYSGVVVYVLGRTQEAKDARAANREIKKAEKKKSGAKKKNTKKTTAKKTTKK